jgi:hypothetical protein
VRELFIYYRIECADAAGALAMVHAFQQRLCGRHEGLTARLLRRCEPAGDHSNDPQTWMEIYSRNEADGVSPALQADIESEAAVLTPVIVGARHTEGFVPCAW